VYHCYVQDIEANVHASQTWAMTYITMPLVVLMVTKNYKPALKHDNGGERASLTSFEPT